jgi:hypothetical protein
MDFTYALVDHFTTVPSEGSTYTVDATPKTGGKRNSDNYTSHAHCESTGCNSKLCLESIARKHSDGCEDGTAEQI